MLNLLYEPLPDAVTIDGRNCPVVTDFREWIRFHDLLTDRDVPERSKLFMLAEWFQNPPVFLSESHLHALLDFYRAKPLEPERDIPDSETVPKRKPPVFDWKFDSADLLADFRQFYQLNLLTVGFLHWFEFCALFRSLPEDSRCQKKIWYRSVKLSEIKDKDEKKRIRKIKRAVAIPYEMSDDEIAAAFENCF